MAEKRLQGMRVAILAADGFEQVELTFPRRALRKRGAEVRIISLRHGRIRGMNLLWRGRKVKVDAKVNEVQPEDFDALLIPGGFINPDFLRQSEKVLDFVRRFDALDRPIATICHGPWVLISAGLTRGRFLAAWPGIKDDVRNSGAEWVNEPGVRDRNWFSSRSPLDMPTFIPGMVALFELSPSRPRVALPEARGAPRFEGWGWRRWAGAAALGMGALNYGARRTRAALAAAA